MSRDHRVLPQLAVDRQAQAQVAEPLELVGVQQHQRRADRGERRVGLGFVELGLRQLHVAGGDVVGDHQAGDVVGQLSSVTSVPTGISRPITRPISTS